MKTLMKLRRLLSVLIIPALVLYAISCSDPVTEEKAEKEEEPIGGTLTPAHADKAMESLLFKNSSNVSGSIPTVANTSLIKTNIRDTLYLMEGVKVAIRLSHPLAQPISGIFIVVKNSTYYQDVPVEIEEESDTVSIIFADINPNALELPLDLSVDIVPYDANDQPIDIVERIITIEEPASSSNPACDITIPRPSSLPDTTGTWAPEWFWFSTTVFNASEEPIFVNAPGLPFITKGPLKGCCDCVKCCCATVSVGVCNPNPNALDASVDASIYYSIVNENFAFFTDGTFVRQTHERKQNFDPIKTDWCGGIAGYNVSNPVVTYMGTHNYVPGATKLSYGTTLDSCGGTLCGGYGSPGGDLEYSCHMLIISRNSGSQNQVRIYVRNPVSEWYD